MECKPASGRNCTQGFDSPRREGHSAWQFDGGLNPADIVRLIRSHSRLWIVPTIACTVLAAAYAFIAAREWQATQALIVRPETPGVSDERLGRFSDLSEMKTVQETILELAKSQGVIEATLAQVGPAGGGRRPSNWPAPRDVEEFRDQIDMRPPGGAEFGKTEVFYLSVLDADRVWAAQALSVLCGELEKRLQSLRDERAQSMIAELKRAVALAEADLAERTEQLAAFEAKIGVDLFELRNMNATVGGLGEVSQELQAIETERRENEALRRENVRLLALLESAASDPKQILATPNSLLRSQPAVNQLKNALVDAQLRTANLRSSRSDKHPFVVAARAAEQTVREQLHAEISVSMEGLKVELAVNSDREEALLAKWLEARSRITRLAESRAEYANLVAATENHARLVEAARKNLADARARQAAAHSASIIGRIDGVDAGVHPVGPSRKTITAAGGVGGLLIGFGLVFLFASPSIAAAAGGESRRESQQVEAPRAVEPERFGLFQGLTLEEAIRSVEGVSVSARNA
jgi:uncharacterized protein involved in exopolysaccharide biosynthesis